jgi:hypothetical protein
MDSHAAGLSPVKGSKETMDAHGVLLSNQTHCDGNTDLLQRPSIATYSRTPLSISLVVRLCISLENFWSGPFVFIKLSALVRFGLESISPSPVLSRKIGSTHVYSGRCSLRARRSLLHKGDPQWRALANQVHESCINNTTFGSYAVCISPKSIRTSNNTTSSRAVELDQLSTSENGEYKWLSRF